MEEEYYEESKSVKEANERLLKEREKVANLFIVMSFAIIGFIVSQTLKEEFEFSGKVEMWFISIGTCLLFICVLFLIGFWHNKLNSVNIDYTRIVILDIVGDRKDNENFKIKLTKIEMASRFIFKTAIILFYSAQLFIFIGLVLHINGKFIFQ